MRFFILCIIMLLNLQIFSQGCCSGGSGSPIAGGASQGVLQERQFETSLNHQYISTDRFYVKDRDTTALFKNYYSNYLYARVAYGVTQKLTLSIESGYFINKTQYGLAKKDTVRSSGIADLIIFPRYNIYTKNTETSKTEITLGMGLKMPLGKYNDSTVVYRNPSNNVRYYTTSPPTIQPTNGSQDFIFYGFFFKSYTEKKLLLFSNIFYIKKGWNPLGQKFGDYAALALFVGKTIYKKLNITLQVRGEYIAKMQHDKNIDMLAIYNIDVQSTGSRKVFVSPQLSYTHKNTTAFVLYEYPLYQYLNGTQVGSQMQITSGIAYRFFVKKKIVA